ncbi:MAG: exodeoxyribonuclease VII large subunit [Chlamydiales bacterium]|nr:exodeoxyribonuclease VII large subunit [Chlamydiales bacterium]
MTQSIWTVSQLTQAIKTQLEQRFSYVQVKGEISNLKIQASGHIYFTLKDAGSQVSSVLFRGNATRLARMPRDGDEVICKAEVSVYLPRGQYQMIVREMQFSGVGDLLLKFHELKEKLAREGLFERKRPLPAFPKVIGVVTSPTGAVIQDILNVLKRRSPGFQLILNPVKVQGAGAANEIAEAIDFFNRHQLADVLIVGRGGGSLEDLWPFNEECVPRAVARSQIPVISAVGHETDVSLCDFAADVRAPTPSAAAEIAMREKAALSQNLINADQILLRHLKQCIHQHRLKLQTITCQPVISDPYAIIGQLMQRIDEMGPRLDDSLKGKLERKQHTLNVTSRQLETKLVSQMEVRIRKERLKGLISHLKAIDPKNLLKKGYAIVFNEKDDSVMMSAKDLNPTTKVRLQFADGSRKAAIYE